jgi:hypothetical protein
MTEVYSHEQPIPSTADFWRSLGDVENRLKTGKGGSTNRYPGLNTKSGNTIIPSIVE